MHKHTFWARLGEIFRPAGGHGPRDAGLPPVADDGLLVEGPTDTPNDEEATAAAERPLSRWGRREQTLQQLQDGYQRLTELIDSMQRHMASQGERSERIASSLDRLARSLADLPAEARQQIQTLDAIAAHLETTNARAQSLADSVRQLPAVTRAQGEALDGMKQQLDMANETHVQLNHSLQSLGQAVGSLCHASQVQADSIRGLHTSGQEREGRLAELVVAQQRRFTRLFTITLILAVIGAATGVTLAALALLR